MRTTTKLTRSNSLQTADLVATGREFRKQDRFEEALAAFDEAIRLAPAFPKAHAGRALTLARLELLAPSVESFREAVRLDPDLWRAWNSLAGVYNRIGDHAGAIYASRRAAEISNDSSAGSNLLLTLNCDPTLAPADLLEEHRRWAARHAPLRDRHAPFPDRHASSAAHPPHANLPTMGRRLRIGYVSGDFRRHALLFVFEPLLAAHDRDAFEITCFDNTRKPDAHTERLRAMADHWHIIRDMTDDCAEALIRSCAIDILVDLSGHTAWNRLPLFGRKPAPVQATYAGYPNTTGVPAMDYRIVDALTDPADTWLTERALRLPREPLDISLRHQGWGRVRRKALGIRDQDSAAAEFIPAISKSFRAGPLPPHHPRYAVGVQAGAYSRDQYFAASASPKMCPFFGSVLSARLE
jgi:predicted O-linked N-acetylglucosamine transferase (SPINDLY family)